MPEYIKTCADCGREFRTKSERKKLCDECTVEHKRESNRKASKQVSETLKKPKAEPEENKQRKPLYRDGLSISSFVRLLERYNRQHHTRYTYGQALLHLSSGIIPKEEFYS